MQKSLELPNTQIRLNNRRMSELICEQISDWIMDGTLEAGQKISEDDLAEKFGVSRMPVREAIRMLGAKGLVQSVPYAGSTVRKLNESEIREVYMLRSVLEPLACKVSSQNIDVAQLKQLVNVQNALEACGEGPIGLETSKSMYQLNREFHMCMYRPCGMERLMQMIDNLWDSIAYLRMRTAIDPRYPKQMQQEHRRYISLLEQRDGETLAAQLEENLKRHIVDIPGMGAVHILGSRSAAEQPIS